MSYLSASSRAGTRAYYKYCYNNLLTWCFWKTGCNRYLLGQWQLSSTAGTGIESWSSYPFEWCWRPVHGPTEWTQVTADSHLLERKAWWHGHVWWKIKSGSGWNDSQSICSLECCISWNPCGYYKVSTISICVSWVAFRHSTHLRTECVFSPCDLRFRFGSHGAMHIYI